MNTIITEKVYNNQLRNGKISKFFKTFKISDAMKKSNFYKKKGVKPIVVLNYLFALVFRNKNIYLDSVFKGGSAFCKNTAYRFLNSPLYNWCKLLYIVALNVIARIIPLTSEKRENVLIFDDTLYSRSRSKSVDMLSKVYDHNTNSYIKGFKLLTLAWSDGNTTIPLGYQPLVSTNDKMVINGIPKDLDKRTKAYKLRIAAQKNPVEAMFDLLSKTDLSAVKAKYVLFDSWFAFPKVIMKVCNHNLNVICMLKRMYRVYYDYKGKRYNLAELYNHVPHSRSGEIIASVKVKIHNDDDEEQLVKVLFLRSKKSNDWVALLSTDLELCDEEIIRIYGKRWSIEVMFKVSKHYLKLDSELEGRSFESIYAHSAIVFLRYIMLEYENRISLDDRTCGEIFFIVCEELRDISFMEALCLLLEMVLYSAANTGTVSDEQINALTTIFLSALPHCFCVY